jgi:PKD repeat protein
VLPTSNVRTNGPVTTIYIGYGPQSVQLQASSSSLGLVRYTWSPAAGLSNPNIANPVFAPTNPGVYYLTVTAVNSDNCSASESVTITVVDVRCGPANDKVLVCHNDKDGRCVSTADVQNHINHGDMLGNCEIIPGDDSFAAQNAESKLTSSPNPAVSSADISFALREAGTYRVEVLNMQGTVVAVLGEGSGAAGQRFSLPFNKGRLTGEVYIVHLVTGRENQFTRVQFKD